MKKGSVQGFGVFVAIIFTFLMLTVGRIPSQREIENNKKEAEIAAKEEKIHFESELVSLKDSDGHEYFSKDNVSDTTPIDFTAEGTTIFLSAKLSPINGHSLKDLDVEDILIECESPYLYLSRIETEDFNLKSGMITVKAEFRTRLYTNLQETRSWFNVISRNKNIQYNTYKRVACNLVSKPTDSCNEDQSDVEQNDHENSNRAVDNNNNQITEETITEENIDDYDHILDDYEIENYIFEDGVY